MKAAFFLHSIGLCILFGALMYALSEPGTPNESRWQSSSESRMERMPLSIQSASFSHEGFIPARHTCDGLDSSPSLTVQGIPAQAVSLTLIVKDPDVPREIRNDGTWYHWVRFNIPTRSLDTLEVGDGEDVGGTKGVGTGGDLAYEGPCPPGGEHRYFFKLYALDTILDIPEGVDAVTVERALEGHVLGDATLMGRYERTLAQ